MQHLRPESLATIAAMLLLFAAATTTTTHAHNITHILAKYPEYSTFNHYLTLTHLAQEINQRTTITVCAVDNAAMSDLLSKHPSIYTVKNILSLHVLLDYFGAKKLHQITNGTALAATMFQATGTAPGSSGFVNITDLRGGKVGFGADSNNNADNDGAPLTAFFVKSVEEIPYNISVLQISKVLPSAVAEAPTPAPSQQNLTSIMSKHGCKVFADTLLTSSEAISTFSDNVEGGLTVFCPIDDAFKAFLPKFKNLTVTGKASLLEYHGIPVYQSLAMLKSNNGILNTLATDGASKYDMTVQNDGEQVTLRTKIDTAKITGTLIDEQPLAIYTVDKVLLPLELFKAAAPVPAPAPAPEPASADAPAAPKKHKKKKAADAPADSDSDSPADSPDDAADQSADDNSGGFRFGGERYINVAIVVALVFGFQMV
ncbi:hypothetical protein TanjilG_11634 [Lupinus angustifolius]|uniref:FAS1 domain-containing protein n=1 Tax=Lupinus angustifolius TaxID=3871 RepID=A0A1J7H9K3_LUPAN|nr:PREDICTED: fasciclin-like arabinogalactan protein 1 [Lupinus angustifolius]OIW09512.1 hypothetical protein TanjilG_11634 [Lupinus angustifolius]